MNVTLTKEDLIRSEIIDRNYKFVFRVEVVFGEREGTINFRVRSGNKVLGAKEVEFVPQN